MPLIPRALAGAWLSIGLVVAPSAAWAASQTLYDPGLGSLPAAQGWSTLASDTPGSQALAGGLLGIDTTAAGVGAFGHVRSVAGGLDTAAGFILQVDLRVRSEAHSSDNRAGFSLLLQGADQAHALELGFWEDRIWALDHQPGGADSGFVRGATVAFDTTAALHTYTLRVQQQAFTLDAGGPPLLSGALRDYPVLGLSTAVYGLPSIVFLGDNSSRGQAAVDLGRVLLQPVPEPAALALWTAGLGLLGWRLRRR